MKTGKAMFLAMALVLPLAAGADDLRDEMLRCAQLKDPQVRLACYDALAAVSASAETAAGGEDRSEAEDTPATGAAPATTAANAPRPGDGENQDSESERSLTDRFFGMLPGSNDGDNKIESRVVGEIEGLRRGKRFELENGQVWRQVDDTKRNYSATNPKVEIKEGFMNSYRMRLEGLNARIRVRRVE